MKTTIREVMAKLSEIEGAKLSVERLMNDDANAYTGENPKNVVLDLLYDYSEMIKNTKVDI